VIDPSTGEAYATAPVSGPVTSTRPYESPSRFLLVEADHAVGALPRLFRIADAIEARAEELVAVESEDTGKPVALTLSEEILPPVTRSASSPARHASSRPRRSRVHGGHTSYIRREPIGSAER